MPPASHPYAPKRRETSMLTRRRGSIPDIKQVTGMRRRQDLSMTKFPQEKLEK